MATCGPQVESWIWLPWERLEERQLKGQAWGGGVAQFPVHSGMGKTDLSLRPSAVFVQSSASSKTVEACAPLSLPFSAPLSPWEPNARIKM